MEFHCFPAPRFRPFKPAFAPFFLSFTKPLLLNFRSMSRVEELRDDSDESINHNQPPRAPSIEELYEKHITGPEQSQISSKSFEEIVQDMNKTPLFMNNLDEATDEGMQNSMANSRVWLSNGAQMEKTSCLRL